RGAVRVLHVGGDRLSGPRQCRRRTRRVACSRLVTSGYGEGNPELADDLKPLLPRPAIPFLPRPSTVGRSRCRLNQVGRWRAERALARERSSHARTLVLAGAVLFVQDTLLLRRHGR